jgi:cell division protein FtsQ
MITSMQEQLPKSQKTELTVLDKNDDSQKESEAEKAPLIVGIPFFIAVIGLIIYGVYWTKEFLQDEQRLPVQEILFSGQMKVLNETTLEELIRTNVTQSFFAIDVNEVHALLEAQAWVYSASIRKRWPSRLYVHIIEQTAVARWNDDFLHS